ncbi:unnamed protein product [Zymoseptoria tritici ST99CH_3D1]|uniref:Enoyl reductase (ER) domain-containing protein n=2 Tax=Zymoseptoria tritici TaxID=1047171 RepID=A0A1X7RHF5_ZYMT9|nr:unnamed protein product [Zymoseptoria tritici ST99CH_3D7]SMR42784.1 unnamed protein product [Zymoseptoria tritici ST99CH_1E4]SMR44955.1 unnamed protein product [Zymoseptoria tritici ST99CH_3D1]
MATTESRAWTFTTGGYPQALKLSSATPPTKEQVKPKHVLVKIKAAGLNPVDVQIMNMPIWSIPIGPLTAEKTLCSDFSGTVIAAGEGADFVEGDEIFGVTLKPFAPCGGTMAEIAHINLDNACVVKKPREMTFVQAAGLGCVFLTARTCIEHCIPYVEPNSSKRVVVLGGSSSAGMYTVYLAKQRGWKVLSTCSGKNAGWVQSTMGADEIIDYTMSSVPEGVKRFQPDAIIDCVGGVECHGIAKRYVTIVGDKTSRLSMGGSMTYLWTPYLWVRWGLGRLGLGEVYDNIVLELKKEWLEESKRLPDDKLITDSTFAFEDARSAYERLNTGRARGKVIVEVSK